MEKKKILLLVDWLPGENTLLLDALRRTGLHCDVQGIKFHQSKWTPINKIFSHWPRCFWVSMRVFRESHKYDYVLAWSQIMGTFLGLLKFITGSHRPKVFILEAVIVERNSKFMEHLRRLIIRTAWKKVEHIGFMSLAYKQLIQERYHLRDNQGVLLKSPLICLENQDVKNFRPDGYVYSAGRSYRDYRTLMAAAQKSTRRFVVLTSDDAIKGLVIPDNVEVHRNTFGPEADRLFRDASVVVIPLDRTTSPAGDLTLTEAMSHGKPVIITATLITQEYIVQCSNGYLVPPRDPDTLAETIDAIFNDPEKAAQVGLEARKSVLENHSLTSFCLIIREAIRNDTCT